MFIESIPTFFVNIVSSIRLDSRSNSGISNIMVILNELKIDRKLLDKDFEGYKLSLTPIPVYQENIPEGVDVVEPSDDQYSFLNQREFTLHNHLSEDPWAVDAVYFVDQKWKVKKTFIDPLTEKLAGINEVWEIPRKRSRVVGHLNVSLSFASSDIAVVADGTGLIHIVNTGLRKENVLWKLEHTEESDEGYRLVDARSPAPGRLSCLIVQIKNQPANTLLSLLNFTTDENEWKLTKQEVFVGTSGIDYAALEADCTGFYIVSQSEFISKSAPVDSEQVHEYGEDREVNREPDFEWQQNLEEIRLWIPLRAEQGSSPQKLSPSVKIVGSELRVEDGAGTELVGGRLFRPVEEGLATWTILDARLEVILMKTDEGNMWPQLFDVEETKYLGKEVPDPQIVEEIHSKLAHLCSESLDVGGATVLNTNQLEECDISEDEARLFIRYDGDTGLQTSKTRLGSGQWLMSGPRTPDGPPLLVVRCDVDGLVWQVTSGDAPLHHYTTLPAFGYVQASKANRKFLFIPSDLKYTGLIDSEGRVFLYQTGQRLLRNRKEGILKKEVAFQHLINLPHRDQVLGAVAVVGRIFILTDQRIYLLSVVPS